MKYVFILGNNPELSVAEIKAILPDLKALAVNKQYLVGEAKSLDCEPVLSRLGGTIKIARIVAEKADPAELAEVILKARGEKVGKINFGVSYYGKRIANLGMEIKGILKGKGLSCRLVVSREPILSSVIVKKEKCLEIIVSPEWVALTEAVQDFAGYSWRDFGRPQSDALSGMLPPKLAKMMINLSSAKEDGILLDPFCGSGTVMSEALAMGFKNLIGSDVSPKAVDDTQKNLNWLEEKLKIEPESLKLFLGDVKTIAEEIPAGTVDAIATEPYLGPPMKGNEKDGTIRRNVEEVENLYVSAFEQFAKILKPKAMIVMVFPEWHIGDKIFYLHLDDAVKAIGFERLDDNSLIYKRENQKVWRRITIWRKK